jgi:hypothetical protein
VTFGETSFTSGVAVGPGVVTAVEGGDATAGDTEIVGVAVGVVVAVAVAVGAGEAVAVGVGV